MATNLVLVLTRLQSERSSPNQLPFALGRKLGDTPDNPMQPPKPHNLFGRLIGGALAVSVTEAVGQSLCQQHIVDYDFISNHFVINPDTAYLINQCHTLNNIGFVPLANIIENTFKQGLNLNHCKTMKALPFILLKNWQALNVSNVHLFANNKSVKSNKIKELLSCQTLLLQPIQSFQDNLQFKKQGAILNTYLTQNISKSLPVPCRHYPIPEPPPKPFIGRCRLRPSSNRLPFHLTRKRGALPSSALPFTLMCWHENTPKIIPNLRTYVVKNTITAQVAGININPLSFNIKCDMNGYCWSGSLEITTKDFLAIKTKFDTERGNEPFITIDINGFLFCIVAEEISRSRAFVNHSYHISGRSVTARLGADYAKAQSQVFSQDSYASQIVNGQLVDLPITVDRFEIADWFIPTNHFSIANQTPIAVIAEIAKRCGGFVLSHPNLAKLSLQKRWKVNAWNLATANPDVVLPMDVVKSINDQKRSNPRYNTVTLIGQTQGGEVYRQQQGRDRVAPIDSHALYSDQNCIIPQGQAILSDSGTHADYQIVMRWADKYHIPLAELGQIWQVNDPEGAFKGVVTSVAVNVSVDNDVPMVWQTVSINRYMDV